MSRIHINTEALRIKARELETLRQKDMETLKQIRILILGLEDIWKGNSADSYLNAYLSRQNDLNDFYSSLAEFISVLNEAVSQADNAENELLSAIYRI